MKFQIDTVSRLVSGCVMQHNSARVKRQLAAWVISGINQPFNDRIFGYNSGPAAAREVFKPSTDAESLLGSIRKKHFLIRVRGSPGGGSQSGGVFVFLTSFDAPWTPIPWAKILVQTCFRN